MFMLHTQSVRLMMALAVLGLGAVACNDSSMVGTTTQKAPVVTPAPTYQPPLTPQVLPTVAPQLPQTQVVFGGPMDGFHIGDSNFDATSNCATQVRTVGTSGRAIQYTFTTFEPNTSVNFRIVGLCGVDMTSNTISLSGGATQAVPMTRGTVDVLPGTIIAMPGTYTVTIRSGTDPTAYTGTPDYDDFLFESMTLTSNRNIQIGTATPLQQ